MISLSEEFDVQHLMRPHKILTKLTAASDAHIESDSYDSTKN